MPSGHVFIGTSLDGFIARPDGGIDWLDLPAFSNPGEDYGYGAFFADIDALIIGSGTFRAALGFDSWPYDRPTLVLSRSVQPSDLPARLAGKVTVADLSPADAMAEAARRGWRRVYVDGGAVIRSFLRAGLIEDMVLTRLPILLGEGLPLFGPLGGDVLLEHLGTRSFASGFVQSRYRVLRTA